MLFIFLCKLIQWWNWVHLKGILWWLLFVWPFDLLYCLCSFHVIVCCWNFVVLCTYCVCHLHFNIIELWSTITFIPGNHGCKWKWVQHTFVFVLGQVTSRYRLSQSWNHTFHRYIFQCCEISYLSCVILSTNSFSISYHGILSHKKFNWFDEKFI